MLCRATSRASPTVNVFIAPFVEAYAADPGPPPVYAPIDEILIMTPPLFGIIVLRAWRQQRKTERILTA